MAFQENVNEIQFSIIIPCYNQGEYLGEAIESILSQDFKNWECIIVNDGSTDETVHVAEQFCIRDQRITLCSQENRGLPDARNTGIAQARGTFILPLDADDKIAGDYLSVAHAVFTRQNNIALVYGRAEFFGNRNGVWQTPDYSYRQLLTLNVIFCSAIFRKTDWERCGHYDITFRNGFEDWDFWIRLLDENSIVYQIPETVFYYRIKEKSMLVELLAGEAEAVRWKLFRKHINTYNRILPAPQHVYHDLSNARQMIGFYQRSKEYRLGRMLFFPFRFLKKVINA